MAPAAGSHNTEDGFGDDKPMTHLQLVPKEHFSCSLELEEEISRDLQSLKKALTRFWATISSDTDNKDFQQADAENQRKRTVFIETSFE